MQALLVVGPERSANPHYMHACTAAHAAEAGAIRTPRARIV
jgi:hypothetical protein